MSEENKNPGERLVEVDNPIHAHLAKHHAAVEKHLEKEMHRLARNKKFFFITGAVLLIALIIATLRIDPNAPFQTQLGYAYIGMWGFVYFILMLVWFVIDKNTLEIRKDIKELSLEVKELKESSGKK
jgi:hypothetical protein